MSFIFNYLYCISPRIIFSYYILYLFVFY